MYMTTLTPPRRLARSQGIDAARGIAMLLMILDHALVVAGQADSPLRYTLTRAALPLFMVIAGAMIGSRLRWRRLLRVAIAGLAVPLFVPWIDRPNILVLYVAGAVLVWGARRFGDRFGGAVFGPKAGLWWLLIGLLTLLANGWGGQGSGYPWTVVAGLMAVGAWIGRQWLAVALVRLERAWLRPVAWLGRFPVAVYVGHLAVLQVLAGAL